MILIGWSWPSSWKRFNLSLLIDVSRGISKSPILLLISTAIGLVNFVVFDLIGNISSSFVVSFSDDCEMLFVYRGIILTCGTSRYSSQAISGGILQ